MKQWMIQAIEQLVFQLAPVALKAAVDGLSQDGGELFQRVNELETRVAKLEKALKKAEKAKPEVAEAGE